jgi:general secretion pathway protein L
MSVLRIYFSGQWRDGSSLCPWALCNDEGDVLQSGNSTLDELPQCNECVGIVAADRVLLIATTLPAGSRRRWQSMLPFVAEEFTLDDPEENHVVPGPVLSDGRRMLAVVDKHWLSRIVELARDNQIALRRMVVESLMPVLAADSWTVVWDGSGGFVKTGPASGVALDTGDANSPPLTLRLCLDAAPDKPKTVVLRLTRCAADGHSQMPSWPDWNVPLTNAEPWDWRREAIPENSFNLLWGEFAPRAKIREWWPKLRPAAYLLLIVLVVEIAGNHLEWAMLANQKHQLTQKIQRIFRNTFGDSVVLVNAPLQMNRNLAELRNVAGIADTGDFLSLLGLAGRTLATLPIGSVVAMHFEAGRLDVDIKLARRADFSGLKQRLQNKGLSVRVGDIHETGSAFEGRMTLMPEGVL